VTEELRPNYEVRYLDAARREARKILDNDEQYLFCVEQARLLRFFPSRTGRSQERFFNLDIKKVEDYWELRVWDKVLEHKNIRIMFAPFSRPRAVLVLCVYQKQTEQTPLTVKVRCRNRVRQLVKQGYKL
jgi:phage-related protein